MTETSVGRQSVGDETEMVEEVGWRERASGEKVRSEGGKEGAGGRKVEKGGELVVEEGGGFGEEDVRDDGIVERRAAEVRDGDEVALGCVVAAPVINSGGVAVTADVHVGGESDVREVGVVESGKSEGRADSEEGNAEGPRVFERDGQSEELFCADEGRVGEGGSVKGSDGRVDGVAQNAPDLLGEDEKEEVVGKEGRDEDVGEEDALGEGECL